MKPLTEEQLTAIESSDSSPNVPKLIAEVRRLRRLLAKTHRLATRASDLIVKYEGMASRAADCAEDAEALLIEIESETTASIVAGKAQGTRGWE